jgi:hypothetical protein
MSKRYVCDEGDGPTINTSSTTHASGSQRHLLDFGPTLGRGYGYSGDVVGNVKYVVDNGPTLGLGRSST